ncbi:MAG: hypothetical protein GF398_12510 [Chitinivibrionales bacterium]|nr:hypothetical protein [Chitinivibrionales bacterium]
MMLSDHTLQDIAAGVLAAFGTESQPDHVGQLRLQAASRGDNTGAAPFKNFISVLDRQEFSVLTFNPGSFEAWRAAASAPVLIGMLFLPFSGRDVRPLDIDRRTSWNWAIIDRHAENLHLDFAQTIVAGETAYTLRTSSGCKLGGAPNDNPVGQVTARGDSYTQCVGAFVIMHEPRSRLEALLDDWYATLPYTYPRPEVFSLTSRMQ